MRGRRSDPRRGSGLASTLASAVVSLALLVPASGRAQQADLSFLATRAEATDYVETTRYDEAVGFLEVLAAQDPLLHLRGFGHSVEGRMLPLVIYGDVGSAEPAAVRSDGRTRIFVQANIHAGEVCGKEAMLALLRDLSMTGRPAWSDSVLLLVAPIYNVDGNERVSLFNRPRQHGPFGGMGQRANAQDLDLNRDHMKLASPEARSLVRLMREYDPHLVVDLHTTNGTRHGYHVTYAPPLHPNTHPAIVDLVRERLLPDATGAVLEETGWAMYYYGNLPWRGMSTERGWYTFDHRPRFNNNYVGLRNRVAVLSEAYAYAPFRDRVLATRAFVEAIIDWTARNASLVRSTVALADADAVPGSEQGLRAIIHRSDEPVDIVLGDVATERHPSTGAPVFRMTDDRTVERQAEFGSFEPSESTVAPDHYLVPAHLGRLLGLLDDHGVMHGRAEAGVDGPVERFRIDSTRVAERAFQGVHERELFGAWIPDPGIDASGMVAVPVNQPLGRLVVALLEPRSDDGAVNWGVLDRELEDAGHYPVLRVPVR